MPPPLALALTLLLIGYLFHRDYRVTPRVTGAVWIPTIWFLLIGSRQPSQWLGGGRGISSQALYEGNPADQAVYASLIVAGLYVLANRRVQIGQIAKVNRWIVLLILYEGLSVFWSDFPFLSLKRWVKAVGDIVMVLVLWSDPYPMRAITAAIKRCAYLMIPLSLLFCKYYENLGRAFDSWGNAFYTGVTLDKNMFGYLLFAFGLFFAAALVQGFTRHGWRHEMASINPYLNALMLGMIVWLIPIANSKTSTLALLAGIAIILALRFRKVRRHFWLYFAAAVLVVVVGNELFPLHSTILEAAGRDASLTGRTGIWETVLSQPNNPLIGTGYASFWLGERLQRIWAIYPNTPLLQAHNGYIEVYLNLGLIGVMLLSGVLWTGLRRARARLSALVSVGIGRDEETFRTFGMAYAAAYLLYNYTEATFVGQNFLFVIFLVVAFSYRQTPGGSRTRDVSTRSPASR